MLADSATLHEGVNTLPLSTYPHEGFNGIYLRNADNTPYYSEVAPGSVQYGNSQNEYNAPWEVDGLNSNFYMEGNPVYSAEDAFINAVIFGKTYQVRFE